jgi:hypothetical protein
VYFRIANGARVERAQFCCGGLDASGIGWRRFESAEAKVLMVVARKERNENQETEMSKKERSSEREMKRASSAR